MKAFNFDHHLIDSYARFSRSFSAIRSADLKSEIDRQYDAGRFWPNALLSLNPHYLEGPTVDDLASSGDLDEATGRLFRFGITPIRFHRHQAQSIAKARAGHSFVVTTGTGSGKSLCFFVPIVDAIIRARRAGKARRTSAIIVYPMNALANSQIKEIDKFIAQSGLPTELRPIVRRYTGQESKGLASQSRTPARGDHYHLGRPTLSVGSEPFDAFALFAPILGIGFDFARKSIIGVTVTCRYQIARCVFVLVVERHIIDAPGQK